jgi:HEAT repeat protein
MEFWLVFLVIGVITVVILLIYYFTLPPDIPDLQKNNDVAGLLKALQYQQSATSLPGRQDTAPQVRQDAALTLGRMRAVAAIEPLMQLLHNRQESKSVRQAAAVALGQFDDPRVVLSLALALDIPAVSGTAITALKQVGPAAQHPLLSASRHESPYMRRAVITAMAQLGEPWAVLPLLTATVDPDPAIQNIARNGLLVMGPVTIPPLMNTFKYSDPEVRLLILDILVNIGSSLTRSVFLMALTDKDSRVRQAGADGLDRINWQAQTEREQAAYWVATQEWQKCIELGAAAIEPLLDVFNDQVDDLADTFQVAVVNTLKSIGPPAAEALMAMLETDRPHRPRIIELLGQMGDKRATDYLAHLLPDEANRAVREVLVESLEQLGWEPEKDSAGAVYWITKQNWINVADIGPPAISPLTEIIEDPTLQDDIHRAAAEVLEKIDAPQSFETLMRHWIAEGQWSKCLETGNAAIPYLIEALSQPDARLGAIETLGQLGDPLTVTALLDVLVDKRWLIRDKVIKALVSMGQPVVNQLLDVVGNKGHRQPDHVRQVAVETLGLIGDKKALGLLMSTFRKTSHNEVAVRKAAAGALGQLGDKYAVEVLVAAVKDANERDDIRQAAIVALGAIGDDRATAAIARVLANWKEYGALREAAAEALADIGDLAAVDPLIGALSDQGLAVRLTAARALAHLTKQEFGANQAEWLAWWAENRLKKKPRSNFI